MMESEQFISNYDYFNKPHEHLRKYFDKTHGMELIDTRDHPGRLDLIPSMWVGATWKMYFGKHSFEVFPKLKLLSFEGVYMIEQVSEDVVFIQLYEKIEDSGTRTNRQIQDCFREQFNLNEIVSSLGDGPT